MLTKSTVSLWRACALVAMADGELAIVIAGRREDWPAARRP